jgi:hypothetical protein
MSVLNRRNGLVGWVAWTVGKRVLKRKAMAAVPSIDPESKRPNKRAVALLVASSLGALTILKKRSGGGEPAT